jgi:L-histidine N-alpha-methyltransferase
MNTDLHTCPSIETDCKVIEKLRTEVINGLTGSTKSLPSKYLYDKAGDHLFQQIMAMPEYYLTRCELDIFENRTKDLAELLTKDPTPFDLIELGAGDAMKSSYLLKYLFNKGVDFTYRPIDISGNILHELEGRLETELPGIEIASLAGEYFDMLAKATSLSQRRKVILFLGGNIGNMEWYEIERFCVELNQNLAAGDIVLIGFDLKKNPHAILNAYNDKSGITAAFNLNILSRINRELGADFDTAQFEHFQTYDPISGACRSYLVSLAHQTVKIDDTRILFTENELINIEVSQKFSRKDIADLASKSGFKPLSDIEDSKGWFIDAAWQIDNAKN